MLAVLVGLGFGCWALWGLYADHRTLVTSRNAIETGCGGLADPDSVLALHGGIRHAQPSTAGSGQFAPGRTTGTCEIFRVGKPGTTYPHFELLVHTVPSDEYGTVLNERDRSPFAAPVAHPPRDLSKSAADAYQPLGGGAAGDYSTDSVTLEAKCPTPGVTSLFVRASATYDDVTDADRTALASIADGALRRAAANLDCHAQAPKPPRRLPAPSKRLGPAADAGGTCGWYGQQLHGPDAADLPDRALAERTDATDGTERCVLALSPSATETVWRRHPATVHGLRLDETVRLFPWWLEFDSYFGDKTATLSTEGPGDELTAVNPDSAGALPKDRVWWASSVCHGEPAVHTMAVSEVYDDIARGRLHSLFRAYVTDVALRRGCTQVRFPKESSFAKPPLPH